MKNPFQPIRDILPYYPGCIRVIFLILISIGIISGGSMLIADGRPRSYTTYDSEWIEDNSYWGGHYEYSYEPQYQSAHAGKLVGGSLLIILGVPAFLAGIFYYFILGCGYNRFYTNNLVKFEGRGAVKRARKNK